MFRSTAGLLGACCVGVMLGAAPASAQTPLPLTKDGPFPGFERTARDLGTWDATLVGRPPSGRLKSARFVEINTSACDGTCVRTRLVNQEAPASDLARAWWWFGTWTERGASEWNPNGTSWGAAWSDTTYIGVIDTPKGPKGVMIEPDDPRVDVTYPSPDRRIVTVYARAASSGTEVRLLRIVYTRRP